MLARRMLMGSVSIRPSVTTYKRVFVEMARRIKLGFGTEATLRLSYTMLWRNSAVFKNNGTSFWNLVPNFQLRRFFWVFKPRHVDRRKCCQLSLTDDCRQFITPSVQLCLQHHERDAQCHAVCLRQLTLVS